MVGYNTGPSDDGFLWRWMIPTARAPAAQAQLDAARQFAIDAAAMLANTRCTQIVVLDVSGVSPITDFLVIGTGTSPRQLKTACDSVEEMGQPRDYRALSRSGDTSSNWTCIDFVDVVVHLFSGEARRFYDLEGMWGDATPVAWEPKPGSVPA
jgi:ribosome-associated protein